MSKPLQTDNPLDGNLKPVKDSDGVVSALEISTENVRVKNLEVSSNINIGGDSTISGNANIAGQIIGYTTVGIDATSDSYTLTPTMTVTSNEHQINFIAPPSGAVEISAYIYFDSSRRYPVLGLSDSTTYSAIDFPNSNDVTNEHLVAVPSTSLDVMLNPFWVVTGLTAGTTYQWYLGAKTTSGIGGILRWGGTATNEYPPFIFKAVALPSATDSYIVYG